MPNDPEIVIRPANLSDVQTLAVLNKRLIVDENHPNPMDINQLTERMSSWLTTEYHGFLYVMEEVVAAYCLYREEVDFYYLRHLYVDRKFRRQGIGTYLLDWMFAHLWQDKEVRLDVLVENQRAIAFYQQYGFQTRILRMHK
jgi:ribosomal protein S18 acetylase RimI-like enzyme